MADINPRWVTHFNRPLWDSMRLTDSDPYGGLFGTDDDNRRGLRVCKNCGAHVADRGLHYRFHVQLNQMLATVKDEQEREILRTLTEDDEPPMVEVRDGLGNLVVSYPQEDPDG